MTEDFGSEKVDERPAPIPVRRPCFDAAFFSGFLGERARALCARQPDKTPVVLLHLADGSTLDLCHIEQLFPDWMGATVFQDAKTCDRMDLVFVPYAPITRVTISLPSIHERRIGFRLDESPPPTEARPFESRD